MIAAAVCLQSLFVTEAQLGLLLGWGNILFCKGQGGLKFSKIFQKQKFFLRV